MNATNPEGVGIAYRDEVNKERVVRWKKGMTLAEAKPLIEKVPMPFALHFRIASCGGKTQDLTHPFPIEKEVRLDLEGVTKGFVLFHNGHWHSYLDKGLEATIKNRVKVPEGRWSDTRVMAWLAHLHGHGVLEFINEKAIVFGPNKIEIFHPDLFTRVDNLLVSNRLWESHYVQGERNKNGFYNVGKKVDEADDNDWDYSAAAGGVPIGFQPRVCRFGRCTKEVVGGTSHCAEHQPPCRYMNCNSPRLVGTEHCANHQPVCLAPMCAKSREPGENYCLLHLTVRVDNATKNLGPGGDPNHVIPFRGAGAVEAKGDDHERGVSGSEPKVGSVEGEKPAGQADVGSDVPAIVKDSALQESLRWACSLNPKPFRTHTVVPDAESPSTIKRIKNIIAGHNGHPTIM